MSLICDQFEFLRAFPQARLQFPFPVNKPSCLNKGKTIEMRRRKRENNRNVLLVVVVVEENNRNVVLVVMEENIKLPPVFYVTVLLWMIKRRHNFVKVLWIHNNLDNIVASFYHQ